MIQILETFIVYPQYCMSCQLTWVSKSRNVSCIRCKSENVINSFKEVYSKIQKGNCKNGTQGIN
jgi:hypothetical protein